MSYGPTKSSILSFTVSAGGAANGIINAIVVQDIARQTWYTWDGSTWSNAGGSGKNAPVGEPPQVLPGVNNLYVAFNIENQGGAGNITLTISDSTGPLKTKTVNIPAGGNGGIEWTGDMPTTAYDLTLTAAPGDTQNLTIQPSTSHTCPIGYHWDDTSGKCVSDTPVAEIPWPLIAAGAAGVAVIGTGAYLATKKKKPKEAT